MHTQSIHAAVGPHQPNRHEDVKLVQGFLNRHASATRKTLKADGHYGNQTDLAIRTFQRSVLGMQLPDGIVRVGGLTVERLERSSLEQFCRIPPWEANSCKVGVPSPADYADAARILKCEIAAVKAVGLVESSGKGGFYPGGRPVILFERHIFARCTGHVYDKSFSDISNPKPGGYGSSDLSEKSADVQYGKLLRAYNLDSDAALESASWGAFQLMGIGYDLCGYEEVEDFVAAMAASISNQVKAFVSFMQAKPGALPALQAKNWAAFASAYNGANYGDYDVKMAEAYAVASKEVPVGR